MEMDTEISQGDEGDTVDKKKGGDNQKQFSRQTYIKKKGDN